VPAINTPNLRSVSFLHFQLQISAVLSAPYAVVTAEYLATNDGFI